MNKSAIIKQLCDDIPHIKEVIISIYKLIGNEIKDHYIIDPLIYYNIFTERTHYIISAPIYIYGSNSGLAYDHPRYYDYLTKLFKCKNKITSLDYLAKQGVMMINKIPFITDNQEIQLLLRQYYDIIINEVMRINPECVKIDLNISENDVLLSNIIDFQCELYNRINWCYVNNIIDKFADNTGDIFYQIIINMKYCNTVHFIIFTDAACCGNGKDRCQTTWGFLPVTPLNHGFNQCYGEITNNNKYTFIDKDAKQTNNRGELLAIYEALMFCLRNVDIVPNSQKQKIIMIITDSDYSRNTIMSYYSEWVKKSLLSDKANLDIIIEIMARKQFLEDQYGFTVLVEHVRSHQKLPQPHEPNYHIIKYNNMIDKFVQEKNILSSINN